MKKVLIIFVGVIALISYILLPMVSRVTFSAFIPMESLHTVIVKAVREDLYNQDEFVTLLKQHQREALESEEANYISEYQYESDLGVYGFMFKGSKGMIPVTIQTTMKNRKASTHFLFQMTRGESEIVYQTNPNGTTADNWGAKTINTLLQLGSNTSYQISDSSATSSISVAPIAPEIWAQKNHALDTLQ
ncbi:hypothetical protein N9R79_07385 [Vibrio sp.]|nr:hypothetical protein [Vibrio sp.]